MKKRLTNQDKQDTLVRRRYGYSNKSIKNEEHKRDENNLSEM